MRRLFLAIILFGIMFLAACGAASEPAPMAWDAPVGTPAPVTASAPAMESTEALWSSDVVLHRTVGGYGFYAPDVTTQAYFGSGIEPMAYVAQAPTRMLIQRARIEMSSEYFDESVENLRSTATNFGGYIESSNLSHRSFSVTMRIPATNFENALRSIENYGDVSWLDQTTDDVTGQFVDTQRRMEAMLVQEDRLLELVAEAENLQQLFQIEDRLTQVRTNIEFYRGTLEGLGDRVAFSTITVTLWEVDTWEMQEEPEDTFGQRVANAFATSADVTLTIAQGLMIFLAAAIIPLSFMGVIAFIIIMIVRFANKRTKARKAEKMAQYYAAASHIQPQPAEEPPKAAEEDEKE
ncbi:MAG: DUF4349 domain-containing protein [Defluviitaleaceae bacterium]|nr:DUF4349 domain-containing protein [Defluviitaleaceae bacterium]